MRNLLRKPIVLVGMMGSGKSTIGKRLAYKLNLQFYDSDKIIEDRDGLSVLDIYDYRGEEYFREQEEKTIREVLQYGVVVLSTGGGSFFKEDVRKLIKEKAISIWLKTNVETIHERISRRNTRPIQDHNIETIQKLVDEGDDIYGKADITVESSDMEAHFVVDTIMGKLKTYLEANEKKLASN